MARRRHTSIAQTVFDCDVCERTFKRRADLSRHIVTHSDNRGERLFHCPFRVHSCDYKALQKYNLKTHLNVHFKLRPNECTECKFACSDPSSLTRHRRDIHGYESKGSSSENPSPATHRNETRRRRRYTPYTRSPDGTSADPNFPSRLSLINAIIKECEPNTSVAHSAALLAKFGLFDSLDLVPDQQEEGAALSDSGSLTALEVEFKELSGPAQEDHCPTGVVVQPACRRTAGDDSTAPKFDDWQLQPTLSGAEAHAPECLQLSMPAQGSHYVAGTAIQRVCDMTVTDEMFNNFFSKYGEWEPEPLPSPTPTATYGVSDLSVSPPINVHSYAVNDAVIPATAALSPYEEQHTVNDMLLPVPPSLPSYDVQNPAYNSLYEHYGYTTEAASLGAQVPQPDLFPVTTPDMGIYPQVVYSQDVGFFTSYVGTSDFTFQGL